MLENQYWLDKSKESSNSIENMKTEFNKVIKSLKD